MKFPKHGESVPISAGEAADKERLPECKPCPECGSTPKGTGRRTRVRLREG